MTDTSPLSDRTTVELLAAIIERHDAVLADVIRNVIAHKDTWDGCDETTWVAGFTEEFSRVLSDIAGREYPEHKREETLIKLAGICTNWAKRHKGGKLK